MSIRTRIAQIAGHDTTRAILEGLAAKLDGEDEYESQALTMLQAMIDAFPEVGEQEKSLVNPEINEASTSWRNRKLSDLLQGAMAGILYAVNRTLHNGIRNLEHQSDSMHSVLTRGIKPNHLSLSF